jgi:hypothetical protein
MAPGIGVNQHKVIQVWIKPGEMKDGAAADRGNHSHSRSS